MTHEEFQEFLTSIAKTHLRLHRAAHHPEGHWHLYHEIERLSSLSRFSLVVAERHECTELYAPLGKALMYTHISHILEECGALEALDAHADVLFAHLTRDAIPQDDVELLRRAGFQEPEAELTVVIERIRFKYTRKSGYTRENQETCPSSILGEAHQELKRVAQSLEQTPPDSKNSNEKSVKPKKLFTGIGRILGGGIMATGNILGGLGLTALSPVSPIGPDKVMVSLGAAVAMVGQGVDDLRGVS